MTTSCIPNAWPRFPCRDKKPLTARGLYDATNDPDVLAAWAAAFPDAQWAMPTGAVSGVVVVDADVKWNGVGNLGALLDQHGDVETVAVLTGGGGVHLFFTHPGGRVPNSVGKLAPGVDVRADGGYVVLPLSLHASGKRYEWAEGHSPDDLPLAPLPAWILEQLSAPQTGEKRPASEWAAMIRTIPEGKRNDTLARLAGKLFRDLPAELAEELVHAVNESRCATPLDRAELDRTIESIAAREAARVRANAQTSQALRGWKR